MPDIARRPSAVTESAARIVEAPRPEWQGLFLEPDLPPRDEDDTD